MRRKKNTGAARTENIGADITSNTYYDWVLDYGFMFVPAQGYVGQFVSSFRDYPQRLLSWLLVEDAGIPLNRSPPQVLY
jgi:hypothetical protein